MCKEFERDDKFLWVHELVSRCLVCVYWDACKGDDLKTSIVHGYHWVSKRNGVLK